MSDKEWQLTAKISKARGAAEKFAVATATYVWISYIGIIILALVGIFSGWNWILLGSAASAALMIWIISSFANLQTAKLELAAAVAEAESAHRAKS